MNLTHHIKSTRTFILLTVIVLLTVYTAVALSDIQSSTFSKDNFAKPAVQKSKFDIKKWQTYEDNAYPLKLLIPETWTYSADKTTLPGFYTINLVPQKSKLGVRVYISNTDFVAVDDLKGNQQTIAKNLTVTNYDDIIYTIKVGDNYYTFDGTTNESVKAELSEIVRLARFE
jgi:hypothetical protein